MMTDAVRTYRLLQEACDLLDQANEHSIAAHVGHAMALIEERYGLDPSHYGDPPFPSAIEAHHGRQDGGHA